MTDDTRTSEDKARWRRHYLELRARLTPTQVRDFSTSIRNRTLAFEPIASAETVFCFISATHEVDTHLLIDGLLALGKTVLVPRIAARDPMYAVPFDGWKGLVPGMLGILAPPTGDDYTGAVDLCITPGVAFTESGTRLGYGRGYYDTWFSTHPPLHKLALAFECQIAPRLPATDRDIAIDTLVTEKRLVPVHR